MVLELKDKIERSLPIRHRRRADGQDRPAVDDVVSALVNLGYKRAQAEEAVRKVRQKRPGMPVEELIREALSVLMKR